MDRNEIMPRLRVTLIGLVLLLAVAAGFGYGCGDSGGDSTSVDATSAADTSDGGDGLGPAIQKTEFIELGDAICRKVPNAYQKLVEPLEKEYEAKGQGKPPVAKVNTTAALPPLVVALEEFEELEVPDGQERQTGEIIDALEAAKKGVEEKPTSKLSGPESPFDDFQNLTRAYGFENCNRL